MIAHLSRRLRGLNLLLLSPIILVSLAIHDALSTLVSLSPAIAVALTVLGSLTSYVALIQLAYFLIENNRTLLRLYWGRLYLDGFWYYEYPFSGETRFGIWMIEQTLDGLHITGHGYTEGLESIRTRLRSVSPLVESNGFYEITHEKCATSNPNLLYYAKSSLVLDRNPSDSVLHNEPARFTAITIIYGGSQSGETHFDTFRKLDAVYSEDQAIASVRKLLESRRSVVNDSSNLPAIYSEGSGNPVVILVMGRTAAGKTTTAEALALALGFEYISVASLKRAVVSEYHSSDSLRDDLRDAGLTLAIDKAERLLGSGVSIILDASFGSKRRRGLAVKRLGKLASAFFYVYCVTTDLASTRSRMDARRGLENLAVRHHASDWSVFEHVNATFEEPASSEFGALGPTSCIMTVDTFNHIVRQTDCSLSPAGVSILSALHRIVENGSSDLIIETK